MYSTAVGTSMPVAPGWKHERVKAVNPPASSWIPRIAKSDSTLCSRLSPAPKTILAVVFDPRHVCLTMPFERLARVSICSSVIRQADRI